MPKKKKRKKIKKKKSSRKKRLKKSKSKKIENKELSHLGLIKQSRLSVMPIDSKSWKIILKMSSIDKK